MGEEELLRSRAVAAVRTAVLARHDDPEIHELTAAGLPIGELADVLKVPHHGSGDADADFLAASGARVGLISVGADNTYGHPTERLLTWLAQAGMRVHRTDREGDLAVVGSDERWGIASRGSDGSAAAAPIGEAAVLGVESDPRRRFVAARARRPSVTPCRRAGPTRRTHLPASRRDGGGGVAALARGRRRPHRRPRPP